MDELLIKEATISQPLPHSVEAEQAVLGGLMLKNEAFESISDVLVEKDFYNKDHQLIFSAMVRPSSGFTGSCFILASSLIVLGSFRRS